MMPPPGEYQRTPEPLSLRKEFVFFPKRLYYGGWTWGFTYRRRVPRERKFPSGLRVRKMQVEYLTEAQAIMAKLEGEKYAAGE